MISSDGVVQESRPVRKVMSKAKRAEITENFASMEDVVSARFDFNAVKDNKVSVLWFVCVVLRVVSFV